jgi:hypothetical protein
MASPLQAVGVWGSKARDPVLCDGEADRGVPIESAKFGKLVELLVYSRLKPERYSDAVLLVTQLEKSKLLSQSASLHRIVFWLLVFFGHASIPHSSYSLTPCHPTGESKLSTSGFLLDRSMRGRSSSRVSVAAFSATGLFAENAL